MERKLTVKKERVTELTTDELHAVAGGAAPTKNLQECTHTVFGCTTAINCPRPADA